MDTYNLQGQNLHLQNCGRRHVHLRETVANAVRDKGVTASNIPEPLTGLGLARLGIRLPIFKG